jgi:hypothetical protein
MATDYEVTGQRQVDKLNDQGSFDPTMEVTFRVIPENVTGMVAISLRNYEPDFVRSAIEGRVASIKAIAGL